MYVCCFGASTYDEGIVHFPAYAHPARRLCVDTPPPSVSFLNQCTNENLELFSKALYPIRYMASLYIFIAGCIIAGNIHLAQGFGRGMTAIGAFLIVCSFWNFGSATVMHAGIRRHNKCIILAVRNE